MSDLAANLLILQEKLTTIRQQNLNENRFGSHAGAVQTAHETKTAIYR